MDSKPILLLNDGGAAIAAAESEVAELMQLFTSHGIACEQRQAKEGYMIHFSFGRPDDIVVVHSLLENWILRNGEVEDEESTVVMP